MQDGTGDVRRDWWCKTGLVVQDGTGDVRRDWWCKTGLVVHRRDWWCIDGTGGAVCNVNYGHVRTIGMYSTWLVCLVSLSELWICDRSMLKDGGTL